MHECQYITLRVSLPHPDKGTICSDSCHYMVLLLKVKVINLM